MIQEAFHHLTNGQTQLAHRQFQALYSDRKTLPATECRKLGQYFLEQPVERVAPIPLPQASTNIVEIDDDLFSLVTNHPAREQTGEIYVVKDEDDIDFDALLSNRPV